MTGPLQEFNGTRTLVFLTKDFLLYSVRNCCDFWGEWIYFFALIRSSRPRLRNKVIGRQGRKLYWWSFGIHFTLEEMSFPKYLRIIRLMRMNFEIFGVRTFTTIKNWKFSNLVCMVIENLVIEANSGPQFEYDWCNRVDRSSYIQTSGISVSSAGCESRSKRAIGRMRRKVNRFNWCSRVTVTAGENPVFHKSTKQNKKGIANWRLIERTETTRNGVGCKSEFPTVFGWRQFANSFATERVFLSYLNGRRELVLGFQVTVTEAFKNEISDVEMVFSPIELFVIRSITQFSSLTAAIASDFCVF